MATILLDTTDPGEAEEVFSASYSRVKLTKRGGDAPVRVRMSRSTIGALTVDDLHCDFDMAFRSDPLDRIALCRVRSGVVEGQQRSEVDRAGRGEVLALGAAEGLPILGGVEHTRHTVVLLDRTRFRDVATNPPGKDHEPVRLTGQAAVTPRAGAYLATLIDHMGTDVPAEREDGQSALLVGALEQYVMTVVLATFPNTALTEPTAADRRACTPALMQRAVAYIDDNAHRNITLSDIAAASYVTPRAVQYMFRKHRDCTPMQYLRQVRLQYAHLELVAATRATTTVGLVAQRWGFGHVGRFAVAYRQTYGRSPHETLRDG